MTIKDMPTEERPREKLLQQGAETLSTPELLALILRTCQGISGLLECSIEELQEIKGIGLAKAAQLKAVVQLSKRLAASTHLKLDKITSPQEVAQILIPKLGNCHQEKFIVILLDTKNQIISIKEIFKGTLNSAIVHPREIFRYAIKKSSAAIILAHNHPSGDITPSKEDINITKRLVTVGEIIGIDILDHLIIGSNNYSSLKTKNLF